MTFLDAPLRAPSARDKATILTPELRAEIDRHVAKYPLGWKQSAVMPALTLVQEANGGWHSRDLMDDVAAYLDMPEGAVYEVASLYSTYDLAPTAENKICICNSVSCMLRGSEALIEHLKHMHGVKPGQTTEDGRFTLREVGCLGACRHAPAVLIGKTYHHNLPAEALDKLIAELEWADGRRPRHRLLSHAALADPHTLASYRGIGG